MSEKGNDSEGSVERVQIHLDEMTFAKDQSSQIMDQIYTSEYKNLREKVRKKNKESYDEKYLITG